MKCPYDNTRLRKALIYGSSSAPRSTEWVYCQDCDSMFNFDKYAALIEDYLNKRINIKDLRITVRYLEENFCFEITGHRQMVNVFPLIIHVKHYLNHSWVKIIDNQIEDIIKSFVNLQKEEELKIDLQ
jgi:hypothetical protein